MTDTQLTIDQIQGLSSILRREVTVKAIQRNISDPTQLQALDDAQQLEIGLGNSSFFDIKITDSTDGLLNGSFDTYCIDAETTLLTSIDYNGDGDTNDRRVRLPSVTEGRLNERTNGSFNASVYSSYDLDVLNNNLGLGNFTPNPQGLGAVNWLINNQEGFIAQGYSAADIQAAIWSLVDDQSVNLDDYISDLQQRIWSDMYGGLDSSNVQDIVTQASQNADFIPQLGDKIALLIVPDDDPIDGVPDGQITIAAVELSSVGDFSTPTGSIGDTIFVDANGNGTPDAGEGIEGVEVKLDIDNDGTFDATATTNSDGEYLFDGLNSGEYKVMVDENTLPQDVVNTVDPDGVNDSMSELTLATGENNLDQDFGYEEQNPGIDIEKSTNGVDADTPDLAPEIAVDDTVTWTYEVTNTGDVSFDESEVVVTDDQEGLITNIVDQGDGDSTLAPGETWVYEQTGIAQDLSTATTTNTVIDFETDGEDNDLSAGDVIDTEYSALGLTISAEDSHGNSKKAMIFDSAHPTGGDNDLATDSEGNILIISEDGDSSDPDDNAGGGIITLDLDNPVDVNSINFVDIEETGGEVRTFDSDGNLIDTTAIPAPGNNSLQTLNIDDSDVAKVEVELAGSGAISGLEFESTSVSDGIYQNIGTVVADGVEDSDPSHYVNGEPDPQPASLGDFVFEDSDRDGIQDDGETGVEGVTVTLTGGGADGVIGEGDDDTTKTTTTAADGSYEFTNLNPGEEYKVTFSDLPDGFEFTDANKGTDDELDSDADPTNGMTQVVTLAPGENNPTLDAGIVETEQPQNADIDIEKQVRIFSDTDITLDKTVQGTVIGDIEDRDDDDTDGDGKLDRDDDDDDNDGIKDHKDDDDDNDGISDDKENDGIKQDIEDDDIDGDGKKNHEDDDDDGDGIKDDEDDDDDNDGISDHDEKDDDGDGVKNYYDDDDNDDGIKDDDDDDDDGIHNDDDDDDDNDGIKDHEDDDDDGDGVNDEHDDDHQPDMMAPTFKSGDTVTFHYDVSTEGDDPLTNVSVFDDNGTPHDSSDDFEADPLLTHDGFNQGDANKDKKLDPTETWKFTATDTATEGLYRNVAVAAGDDGTGVTLLDADDAQYFGGLKDIDHDDTDGDKKLDRDDEDDDNDGIPDHMDDDDDNDGISDDKENDGDKIDKHISRGDDDDDDDDDDDLEDYDPWHYDTDGDGWVDAEDDDDDNDGISDYEEKDDDGDGVKNYFDDDDNNDGIKDEDDDDDDGIHNDEDDDDDDDGIKDDEDDDDDGDGVKDEYDDDTAKHHASTDNSDIEVPDALQEQLTDGRPGVDADEPTGPVGSEGDKVQFTFTVTNPGEVELSNVVVNDNNKTPDDTSDDFNPDPIEKDGFNVGDTDQDNNLDVGEEWSYTSHDVVAPGQHTNIAKVTAEAELDSELVVVMAEDSANWFGENGEPEPEPENPGIDIEKFTNGVDADTIAEAVEIAAGETVTWTYEVTNTGDVSFAKGEVTVTDDQEGTITDVDPTLHGNKDNILDPGETWIYTKTGTAQDLTTTTTAKDIIFDLTGSSSTTGNNGNVRKFTQDGVSADVKAFSFNAHEGWQTAYLGAYGGGLGVTNQNEGSADHRVDNGGSKDYIVFEFDQKVTLDRAFLKYIDGDSDISVWIGDHDGDISLLDSDILKGFTKENNDGGDGGYYQKRWADVNANNLTGNTLVIAARDDHSHDAFKLRKLDLSVAGETTIGNYVNIGTVTAGSVSDEDKSSYTNPESAPEPENPGIDIEKFTNGVDADTEDLAVEIAAGETVTWTYEVTNTGNVSFDKADINVTDDQEGTITHISDKGDGDEILAPGETWTYEQTGTAQDLMTVTPGTTKTFNLTGGSKLDGPDGNIRTFSAGDVDVKASAFSRDAHGTWKEAFLGAFSSGLGVTDTSEGDGTNSTHKVDNVHRDNYVLFEFSEDVVVDSAFLASVGADSDITYWVGDKADAFNNHNILSDNFLNSLGFTEDNNADHGNSRTADINDGNKSGNILVIAASTSDHTPDDRFKIKELKVQELETTESGFYQNLGTVDINGLTDEDLSHYVNPDFNI